MGDTKLLPEGGHLGKIFLKTMKKYENEINQTEIVSGATETHGSVRLRVIRLAQTLKAKGIKVGDVVLISGINHNDLCIPFLAAICLGAAPLGLTVDMKQLEITYFISMGKPKIIFADPIIIPEIKKVLNEAGLHTNIVAFSNEKIEGCDNFSNYVKETGNEGAFECENFDPKKTTAILACTSGTTGLPKLASISHYALCYPVCSLGPIMDEGEREITSVLFFSPIYWISSAVIILSSCCMGHTRLHSTRPYSPKDLDMASKLYKPTITLTSQVALCSLLEYVKTNPVDFSNFRKMFLGGNSVSTDVIGKLRELVPNAIISPSYGLTEVTFVTSGLIPHKMGACGKPLPFVTWRMVDIETEKEVGPNQPGELRLKGPHVFTCYYNNPEATANAFDKDGWYKTGDLMYHSEDNDFYFVDRIKEIVKFRSHQISSLELEHVISKIPGVMMSAVIALPHFEDGEHPMAFVQLKPGASVSAQEIKDHVKETMYDIKQLRGGVVFLDTLPKTYNGKVDRKKLREMRTTYKGE